MSVRQRLAADAVEDYEKLKATLWEAMESNRTTWLSCPHCRKKSEVPIPDSPARVRAVEIALAEGFGKPGQEKLERDRGARLAGKKIADMSDEELEAIVAGTA